ncbi:MAG: hypothetical protein IDH49_00665 [Gammaproteobacteria bacterium]|nr:hypothetical protein [Gammaproteobacteria bacterium]
MSKAIKKINAALRRSIGLWIIFFCSFSAFAAPAESFPPITVVYPDVQAPYRAVLDQVMAGIADQTRGQAVNYPLSSGLDTNALQQQFERQPGGVVIGLGRRGFDALKAVKPGRPVAIGAVSLTPQSIPPGFAGISLVPDPAILFSRLHQFAPQVRRVHVVFNPEANGWLMTLAREAARTQGVELVTYEARDLRAAARLYREVSGTVSGAAEAIWLPPEDGTLDEIAVLPALLQEVWQREVVVFSGNPMHVKRGALFALYPDNYTLGRSLAKMALDLAKGRGAELVPLEDMLIAVNLRTAEHLNLPALAHKRSSFAAVFP